MQGLYTPANRRGLRSSRRRAIPRQSPPSTAHLLGRTPLLLLLALELLGGATLLSATATHFFFSTPPGVLLAPDRRLRSAVRLLLSPCRFSRCSQPLTVRNDPRPTAGLFGPAPLLVGLAPNLLGFAARLLFGPAALLFGLAASFLLSLSTRVLGRPSAGLIFHFAALFSGGPFAAVFLGLAAGLLGGRRPPALFRLLPPQPRNFFWCKSGQP